MNTYEDILPLPTPTPHLVWEGYDDGYVQATALIGNIHARYFACIDEVGTKRSLVRLTLKSNSSLYNNPQDFLRALQIPKIEQTSMWPMWESLCDEEWDLCPDGVYRYERLVGYASTRESLFKLVSKNFSHLLKLLNQTPKMQTKTLLNKKITTKRLVLQVILTTTKLGYIRLTPKITSTSPSGFKREHLSPDEERFLTHVGYVEDALNDIVRLFKDRVKDLLDESETLRLWLENEGYPEWEVTDCVELAKDCKTIIRKLENKHPFLYKETLSDD